jgi:RNA polymerase primary sigma factor
MFSASADRQETRVRARRTERDAVPRWDYVSSGERLSPALEKELAAGAQRGNTAARDRMISANIPLVMATVRQYGTCYLETEDVIQEGMIGLCTAVDRFDPSRGLRFSTYATYWIRQRILRAIDRNGRLIRLPVDVGYAARKAQVLKGELADRLGREPTLEELAPLCGVSPKRLQAVFECSQAPLPLGPHDDDEAALDVPDESSADPQQALLEEEAHGELYALLQTLSPRDRAVLEARFGLHGTLVPLSDLAGRLGVTPEGVRQIQRRALLKLRRKWEGGSENTAPSRAHRGAMS